MIYNELKQHGTTDFPIELYRIDRTHPKYEMAHHWHSQVEIIRVLEGELNIRLNNKEYLAKRGDILFVNPETVHGAVPDNCTYECIVCYIDFLSETFIGCKFFIESLLHHEYIIQEYIPAARSEFHATANALFDAMNHKSSGYKFRVVGLLYALLGIIIDAHMYSSADGNSIDADKTVLKLKNVLTFIRNNYDKPLSLHEMAQAAGMSPKYFCYFFRSMTTKTPVEYLNSYRIERACRLLLGSDRSVTEIAYTCGFNDLSYFIRTFKSIKGITPAKFRRT